MVVGDVLRSLHVQDLADGTGGHPLAHRSVKGRKAQHVADAHDPVVAAGGLDQLPEFCLTRTEGLLQQQVVARVEQGERGGDVLRVHGAVDGQIGEAASDGQFLR